MEYQLMIEKIGSCQISEEHQLQLTELYEKPENNHQFAKLDLAEEHHKPSKRTD